MRTTRNGIAAKEHKGLKARLHESHRFALIELESVQSVSPQFAQRMIHLGIHLVAGLGSQIFLDPVWNWAYQTTKSVTL
jgi:hypothetical protein